MKRAPEHTDVELERARVCVSRALINGGTIGPYYVNIISNGSGVVLFHLARVLQQYLLSIKFWKTAAIHSLSVPPQHIIISGGVL